jgi:hypothetical protein
MFPTHACMFSRHLTSQPLWVCKMYEQAAQLMPARHVGIRLKCGASPVDHSQGIATVLGDTIGRSLAADRGLHGRATRQSALHTSPRPSFTIPSHKSASTVIGFQPHQDHLSGPVAQCNYPALSYKRTRQPPILEKYQFCTSLTQP